MRGSGDSYAYRVALSSTDTNGDYYVSAAEAAAAMAELRCCGGNCPQRSNCAAETFLLFPPLEDERLGEMDRFNLPQAEYFENVVRGPTTLAAAGDLSIHRLGTGD